MHGVETKIDEAVSRQGEIAFDAIETVIAAIANGEMVVIADDEFRENEGDLVMAAEKVTEADVSFMSRHGCGLICLATTRQHLDQLGLRRMPVRGTGDAFQTAFMESIDAAHGISTGISARDRATTVKTMMRDDVTPQQFVSPGHMFPLQAMEGGVLRRPGHTEAAVDLARLAGLKPAGMICEILRQDGRMARLPELVRFARSHGLKISSVAALIAYRQRHECIVNFVRAVDMPTDFGKFTMHLFESRVDGEHHMALVKGSPDPSQPVLVRLHSECLTGDVFGSRRCDCGDQLNASLAMIEKAGAGIVLYMRQEGRGIGLANKIHAYELQDRGLDTVEANEELGFKADLRHYDVGAQMLVQMGYGQIRLITNNPDKVRGLNEHGLVVVERVPIVCATSQHSERYLKTKKEKLGHLL